MIINTTSLQEQSSEKSEKFVRSFERSRRELQKISNDGVKNIISFLKEVREEMDERLKSDSPDDPGAPFEVRVIPAVEASLSLIIDDLKERVSKAIIDRMEDAFGFGAGVTFRAAKILGLPVALPQVAPAVAMTLARDAVTVFESLFDTIPDKITKELNLSGLGLQSSSQTRRKINRILRTSPEFIRGKRRRIGLSFQAEEITRTEIGRIYSNAQQAASEQLARSIPGLRKRWVTVRDARVRQGHRDTETLYATGGDVGPIPIKQKFKVNDFSRVGRSNFITFGGKVRPQDFQGLRVARVKGFQRRGRVITDHMLFPRDPAASPGNVVQCRCTVIDVIPELERAMDKTLGIIRKGQI